MTFDDSSAGSVQGELFDPRSHQGHLLILRIFDEVSPVVTKFCPTGYVERNGRRWANNAVRCAIADLDELDENELPGKIYPDVTIFTSLLVADLKKDVGRKILIVWRQQDPTDKTSQYTITEMKSNEKALNMGLAFLTRRPEFDQIAPPPPWKFEEPQQQQQGPPPGYGQPQGNGWGNGGQGAQNWGQHDRDYGQRPQQGPPPGYSQDPWQQPRPQQGPPPGYGQPQGGGSFLDQTQGRNHWGQQQPSEAPF